MSKIAAVTQTPSTNRSHFIRAHLLNMTAHQVLGTSPGPNVKDSTQSAPPQGRYFSPEPSAHAGGPVTWFQTAPFHLRQQFLVGKVSDDDFADDSSRGLVS